MTKKISIIVPVYNAEKTIGRCVEALLNQSYNNIEIILVDDGSKDSSFSICKGYSELDKRVIVVQKRNGGVSSARNLGLDNATGEYVMFCDSDDWVESNWCELLINNYQEDSLTMCGFFSIDNENKRTEVCVEEEIKKISRADYLDTKLLGGFVPWNKIYSARVIKENHLKFPSNLTLGEDKIFVWNYLKAIHGDIICIGKCLVNYVWPQNDSLTVNLPWDYYAQCEDIFYRIIADINQGVVCSSVAKRAFYNDCYLQYERAIRRVLRGKEEKRYQTSNMIMKSEAYQQCCHHTEITSNPVVRAVCRCKNCFGVYLLMCIGKY